MSGYSEQLAQWCAAFKFADLPADVVTSTQLRVLDVIGLALAAVPLATGKSVRTAALAMGAGTDARILGTGDRVPAMQVAPANGTMAQALEYDDTHNETVIHISSPMHNRGSAENPLSADDVRAKFRENAARTLDAKAIEAIVASVDGLKREPAIGKLVDLCVR